MGNKSEECKSCSGKGVAGESYGGLEPGYVSATTKYGKLTMTDDRGAEWVVERDETAEAAIVRLEAERDRRHAEVDLRIDEMLAGVRRWDAGRPYPEQPPRFQRSAHAEATTEQYRLTKAQQCAEFMRPLLADWQYSKDILEKARVVGFMKNVVERARELLNVQRKIGEDDGRSYWRLPDTSDFRTSDNTASEVGSSEAAEDKSPPEREDLRTALTRLRARRRSGAGVP